MANAKISELTALTGANVASDDELPIVDTDAGATKRIVASELLNYIFSTHVITTTTIDATDADYTPPTVLISNIVLDDDGDNDNISVTFNAALKTGTLLAIRADDGGSSGHTVILGGSQVFNASSNTRATFDTADDFVLLFAESATRVVAWVNSGVTFDTP